MKGGAAEWRAGTIAAVDQFREGKKAPPPTVLTRKEPAAAISAGLDPASSGRNGSAGGDFEGYIRGVRF